jgi:hypothetical protein
VKHKVLSCILAAGWPIAIGLVVYLVIIPRVVVSYVPPTSLLVLKYEGSTPVSDVKVIVTGREYNVGNVGHHTTIELKVQPTNDSHIEISFLTAGKATRLNAGGYIGPGVCAHITVTFNDASILSCQISYL